MSTSDSSFLKSIKIPLIFLGIFVLLIAISAEVDWFWVEESPLSYVFLFGILLPLVFILGWIIMHRFPEKIQDPKPIEGDRKKFIWSIIIILIMQNSVPVLYMLLNRDELYVDLSVAVLLIINFVAMAAMAAFFPIHSESSNRKKRWVIFFLLAVVPFYVMVGGLIPVTRAIPDLKIIYWIMMWGMVMPLSYVFLGASWKNGGRSSRKAFNIALAGIIMQYSFLEDFLFYALNGQPQPVGGYTALLNFPLDISRLFGHQGVPMNTIELLIWMTIMIAIAVVVIFDVPHLIYKKISKKDD